MKRQRIKEQGTRFKVQGSRENLLPLVLIVRCSVLAALPYQQNISCINTDVPCHNRTLSHKEKIEIYPTDVTEGLIVSLAL